MLISRGVDCYDSFATDQLTTVETLKAWNQGILEGLH